MEATVLGWPGLSPQEGVGSDGWSHQGPVWAWHPGANLRLGLPSGFWEGTAQAASLGGTCPPHL